MTTYSGASKEAISAHYDIDNAFYQTWLDETITYSCALWDDAIEEPLVAAQLRKLDYHIDNVLNNDNPRFLDIGCGWGSLLNRVVERLDSVVIDGLTLSNEQYSFVTREFSENEQVHVYLESWEHFIPPYLYDGIISIGAFEHFIKCGLSREQKVEIYRSFFDKCANMLKPRGKLSLQTIIYENYDDNSPNKFVEEIFPESDLPRPADILHATEMKFELISQRNDRLHYMKTLQCWYSRLVGNKDSIIDKHGEALFVKYQKYLGIFIMGFKTGTVNLSRLELQKL